MLTLLLVVVMLVCIAFLWNEGLWGNAITLVNVVMAGLIATNYFEPLSAFIEGIGGTMLSYTYVWDFLCLWLLFVFVFGVMRVVTDKLTKTKVYFRAPVEHAGRVIVALTVAYVMMAFTCFSLHTAPLAEHSFGGSFHRARKVSPYTLDLNGKEITTDVDIQHHFLGLGPDYHWHEFVQMLSQAPDEYHMTGPVSRWTLGGWEKRTFDPHDRYFFKYGARRRWLEEHNEETGNIRVNFSE